MGFPKGHGVGHHMQFAAIITFDEMFWRCEIRSKAHSSNILFEVLLSLGPICNFSFFKTWSLRYTLSLTGLVSAIKNEMKK
jgi:hypothetical protein